MTSMTIARSSLVALVALLVTGATARAQSVEAESLFRAGKQLMKDGKLAEACDKFEASDRLEPSVGTLLNLADCREKNHQLASAWAVFLKASAEAKQSGTDAKREAEARRRAKALEPRLAYLTISVADSSRVEGLVIKRNGVTVDPALWNQGVPVDPGTYEITGQAPGLEPWSTKVEVAGEGQKASLEVPRFKRLEDLQPGVTTTHTTPVDKPPPPPKAIDTTTPETNPPEDQHPNETDQPGTFTGMRKLSIAAAVVGVGGIAAGALFGSKANDLEKQSNAICPTAACSDMHAVQLNKDAQSDALYANVGFVVGGAAIVGAAALWFLGAPKMHDQPVALTPTLAPDQVGFTLAGSF